MLYRTRSIAPVDNEDKPSFTPGIGDLVFVDDPNRTIPYAGKVARRLSNGNLTVRVSGTDESRVCNPEWLREHPANRRRGTGSGRSLRI